MNKLAVVDITTPDRQKTLDLRLDLLDPVEYRKSGLSLNHIIGCPLDCAYCVRHLFGVFRMREPHALMSDSDAVSYLVNHPFLEEVKPHTFAVLEDLNSRGLTNHVLVITRYKINESDCARLNRLSSLRITVLVTFSGISDNRIEPVSSEIAVRSLDTAFSNAAKYRVILYWRPIVPGLNDSDEHILAARELSLRAHATVFTGLFYRSEIRDYYRSMGLPEPYSGVARRKILPAETEKRIIRAFTDSPSGPLFRKTSCAVSYSHSSPDYNGHYGIREICDICPREQIARCSKAHTVPTQEEIAALARQIGPVRVIKVSTSSVILDGFNEQQRYFMQHAFAFQFHDIAKPHHHGRHGRAEIGWEHVAPNHQPTSNP